MTCSLWPCDHKMATIPSIIVSRGRRRDIFHFRTNKTFLRIPSADVPSCLFTYSFITYSPCLNQLLAREAGERTKLGEVYWELTLSHWGKSRYLNRIRILLTRKRKGKGKWLLGRQQKAMTVTANSIRMKWFYGIIQNICNAIKF